MSIDDIVIEIDAEINRLQQAKQLLSDHPVRRGPGRPPKTKVTPIKPKHVMSAKARRAISQAMKKRWADAKKKAA